jgi:hypothetical protein
MMNDQIENGGFELVRQSEDEVASTIENLFVLSYRKYFLFCGALKPKKNVSRLLSAYAASGSDCPLAIAGPLGWEYEEDLARIDSEQFVSWKIAGDILRQQRKVRSRSKNSRQALELLAAAGSDDPHVLLVRGLATMAPPAARAIGVAQLRQAACA